MTNFTPTVGSVPAQPTQPIPYKLVPMDRDLIPQIAALEQRCFSVPWTEEMLTEELESMNSTCIVAVTDDGLRRHHRHFGRGLHQQYRR